MTGILIFLAFQNSAKWKGYYVPLKVFFCQTDLEGENLLGTLGDQM